MAVRVEHIEVVSLWRPGTSRIRPNPVFDPLCAVWTHRRLCDGQPTPRTDGEGPRLDLGDRGSGGDSDFAGLGALEVFGSGMTERPTTSGGDSIARKRGEIERSTAALGWSDQAAGRDSSCEAGDRLSVAGPAGWYQTFDAVVSSPRKVSSSSTSQVAT